LALQTPKFYLAGSKRARKSGFLRSIGRKNLQSKQALTPPPINPDETAIVMYTSGTTGRPKLVRQRLTEFENDNRFIISKWGDAWLSRKVCATVSQHHIYGLLFGILLPFTAGVPFRRRRVEAPEEFAMLRDQPLMIVTVPAFLKRAVELSPEGFGLRDAWLYSSGGVLERETAAKTAKVFGFWPVEVYGSTETSGIAWRQSKDGPEWTPFDNAEVRLDDEGRLVIRSPYIKDTAGFTTGDLAELLAGGRFLLKGRADSIVKIEEKRVSLPEVEARLLQSGLVEGAAVIALGGRRQQLGAAIALNGRGAEQLRGMEKLAMNRWFRDYLARFFEPAALPKKWRYVQSIPLDAQGKRKRAEIEALFAPALSERRGLAGETILEQSAVKAALEFSVLPESDYFNEHFPAMKILPAVAQFELAVRFASRLLGTPPQARRAKRLKFSALVRPNTPLRLELSKSGEPPQVSFSFTSPDGGTVYSSGAFEIWGGGGGNNEN
jgi:acyl-coenzyme A synthetase/AMP-(fatty) acid ligase